MSRHRALEQQKEQMKKHFILEADAFSWRRNDDGIALKTVCAPICCFACWPTVSNARRKLAPMPFDDEDRPVRIMVPTTAVRAAQGFFQAHPSPRL